MCRCTILPYLKGKRRFHRTTEKLQRRFGRCSLVQRESTKKGENSRRRMLEVLLVEDQNIRRTLRSEKLEPRAGWISVLKWLELVTMLWPIKDCDQARVHMSNTLFIE
ncbi:hypothetical protein Tco_0089719 [Tanacetum coccineum]